MPFFSDLGDGIPCRLFSAVNPRFSDHQITSSPDHPILFLISVISVYQW